MHFIHSTDTVEFIHLMPAGIPFIIAPVPGKPCRACVEGISSWLALCASGNRVW